MPSFNESTVTVSPWGSHTGIISSIEVSVLFYDYRMAEQPPPAKKQKARSIVKQPSGSSCHACRLAKGMSIADLSKAKQVEFD